MLSLLLVVLVLLSSAGQQPTQTDSSAAEPSSKIVEKESHEEEKSPLPTPEQKESLGVLLQPQQEGLQFIDKRTTLPLVLSLVPAYQGLIAKLGDTSLFENRSLVQDFEQFEQLGLNYLLPLEMRDAALYFSLGLDLEKRFIIPQLAPTTQVVELQNESSYSWQSYFSIDRSYQITWQPQESEPLYSWLNIETLLEQIPQLAASLESLNGQSISEIAQNEQALILQTEALFSQLTVLLAPMNSSILLEEEHFLPNFITQFGMESALLYGKQGWSFEQLTDHTMIELPIKSIFSPRKDTQLQSISYNKDVWRFVSVDVFDDDVLENIEELARLVWGEWLYWQGGIYG